jgi:hypothetical protein
MYVYPDFRCPIETMGLVTILFSVLSMWIALGQGKWFVRAAIGVALIGMLVPPKAYQPIIVLSASSIISILILATARFSNRSSHGRGRQPRRIPAFWRRADFWIGLIAGTVVGLSVVSWAVRKFWAFGWLESLLLFAFVASATMSIASLFGDRFRDGPRRVIRSDSERLSFHLRDALLAFVLLAVLFSLIAFSLRKQSATNWMELGTITVIMSAITVTVCGLVTATRSRWRALSLFVLTSSIGSTLFFKSAVERWSMELSGFGPTRGAAWGEIVSVYVLALFSSTLLLWLAGCFCFGRSASPPIRSGKNLSRALSIALAVLIAACVVPIGVEMSHPLPQPDPLNEDSAVFDALAKEAAVAVALNPYGKTDDELRKAGRAEKATLVSQSHERIRRLVRQSFRVPDPILRNWKINTVSGQLAALRGWVGVVRLQAQSDQKQKRFVDASERWCDCIHLANGLARGGDLSHVLTGIGIESAGHDGLASLRSDLPIEQIAKLLPDLIQIDSQRERIVSIKRRADQLLEHDKGWRYRLAIAAPPHLSSEGPEDTRTIVAPAVEATDDAIQRRDATHRLLMTDFAIRLFIAENERSPIDLDELVPRFLPAVPIDPFSGRHLIYRPSNDGVGLNDLVVYCVGTDGGDDDGNFGNATTYYDDSYDFDLDTFRRPVNQQAPFGAMGGGGMGGGMGGGGQAVTTQP